MSAKTKSRLFFGLALTGFILTIIVPMLMISSFAFSNEGSCHEWETRTLFRPDEELEKACDEERNENRRNVAITFGALLVPSIGLVVIQRRMAKSAREESAETNNVKE